MLSSKRILGVVIRQLFLYRRSFSRILDIFYWPTMDILLWGFLTIYLEKGAVHLPRFVSFFLGALILWHILYRSQIAVSVSFLEDIWARNLLNIMVAPLRLVEYMLGLIIISFVKVCFSFFIMSTLAGILYDFNIFKLGVSLFPFVINLLILGWAIGFVNIGLVFWFGQEAEILAWALVFIFLPFSAVFYPVSVLPPIIQDLAWFTPSAHVFEGMRSVILNGTFPIKHILWATGLNVVYLAVSIWFMYNRFEYARKKGIIPKMGE